MFNVLKDWEELPQFMQTPAVYPYYEILRRKKYSLVLKRLFDFILSVVLLVSLMPVMLGIALLIIKDSKGGVFFRQERITQYGKKFYIHKFRTMVNGAETLGSQVTTSNDVRVTKIGKTLRKYRLDELPQLLDIIGGNMSFVGTRPETTKYVLKYEPEMYATLLLPAGITSETSLKYKDENMLLDGDENIDEVYVKKILPEKMKYNLNGIKNYSFFGDILIMFKTLLVVFQ